jgi:hypothetical protein
MRRLLRVNIVFVFMLACLTLAATASAQFGHPLKGSWSGDWNVGNNSRQHVVLNLDWNGKAISGVINPGSNAVTLSTATLDPATWTVHFVGDGKDASGAPVHIVIDGKVENLGAFQRFITGTWTQGSQKGTFKVTRN